MLEKGKKLRVIWELRTPGKAPFQFLETTADPFPSVNYTFGLQPIDGDEINLSPKIRMYKRQSYFVREAVGDVESKGLGRSEIRNNPFLGLGSLSIPYNPLVRPDGSILLVTFQPSGKDDDPKNSELVVVATLEDAKPAG